MIMEFFHGQETVRRYVCATCWGKLTAAHNDGETVNVICARGEDCTGKGFVTQRYADRRREESISELWEVRANYPHLEKKEVKTTIELLAEIGF